MRGHLRHIVRLSTGHVVQNALVEVFEFGTTTAVTDLFDAREAGTNVGHELVSNAQGEVEGWGDTPRFVTLRISDNSGQAKLSGGQKVTFPTFTETAAIWPDPELGGLEAHDHDLVYEPLGAVADHGALPGDTHGLTDTEVFESTAGAQTKADAAAGTVQTNLDDHEGLTTPAHGGIVADSDPRLSDERAPTVHGPDKHSDAAKSHALVMGLAGEIPATLADAADFLVVVPFNMTLQRIKCSRVVHGSAETQVQVRRSVDAGATFADAFGSAAFGASALVATADPTDLDVDQDDVLSFSVSVGGGENLLVELVGVAR